MRGRRAFVGCSVNPAATPSEGRSNRVPIMPRPIAILVLGAALAACAGTRPHIQILPARVLEGDNVSIIAAGLKPGEAATVHIQSIASGGNRAFYGEATFRANKAGVIDLATAAPIGGYYGNVDPRGLFWSQRLLAKDIAGQSRIAALHLDDALSIAADQQVLTLEQRGLLLDRKVLTLVRSDTDIEHEDVNSAGLVGVFYHKKSAGRRPPVIILGGAEGGRIFADLIGPALASRGYAVFGLVYFSPPDDAIRNVPTALNRIPVEQLQTARQWLAARPEVNIDKLALIGASKGGELALLLASTYEWITAVVAYVPSDVVWQGFAYGASEAAMGSSWTSDGRDVPYLPQTGQREEIIRGRQPGAAPIELARISRANMAAATPQAVAAATIPLERSHAALLLVGGGDDRTGDSGTSVARAAARLRGVAYQHPFEALVYPEAGHGIVGTGWRPTTTHNSGVFNDGGTPQADAHAQADSWRKMLDWLQRELRP
jgi:dienelactone hydrolase